jgi:hypothetical protein
VLVEIYIKQFVLAARAAFRSAVWLSKPLACSQILCGYATRWRREGQEKRKNPDGEASLTALRKAASRNENQVSTSTSRKINILKLVDLTLPSTWNRNLLNIFLEFVLCLIRRTVIWKD